LHPELREWKQVLLDAGCPAAIVSGSGPTVFGLAKDAAQAHRVADTISFGTPTVVRSVKPSTDTR
jgi:4-diphosphocytidyl-2-C-methyl-D-erythritol kinase